MLEDEEKSSAGWVGWVVAIIILVIAIYLGGRAARMQKTLEAVRVQNAQLNVQAARAQQIADALTSPDSKQVTLTETRQPAQPAGHVAYLSRGGALVFVASNLHSIPADKTYELWLFPVGGRAPVAAGLFRPDASGNASIVLPPLPAGLDASGFRVTLEDAAGGTTPTLPTVMAGQ